MLSKFFRRSTDLKRRIHKKQNVEIDSAASSGGQARYMKYVSFPWPPLEATVSICNVSLIVKKQLFGKYSIKTKYIAINAKS